MYYCSNYTIAVLLCVVTMFCWGSWGNTQKLAGKTWRFELFYWDYVLGLVLFALLAGFTAGSLGGGPWSFAENLRSSSALQWTWPFLGGIVFNASNILLSAAIAVAGMSVAFPVGVGLALVGGTVANWFVDGKGNPLLIWTGLAVIVASILCNALAFKAKQSSGDGASDASSVKKGLWLAISAGLLMSWFSPLVNRVVDMGFANAAPGDGMMTPYTAFFVFTLGVLASNFVFNTIMMKKPVSGEPVNGAEWFKGSPFVHFVGILGGAIWATGTLLSFVTAGTAGAAIAYSLGQGATLVSALWGILVWREFKGAPKKSAVLNFAMIVLFLAGLALLVSAGGDERQSEKEPVKIVFDTDMYTDFDDVGALACLHALADAGECEILATVANTRDSLSVAMCEIVNAYYGRPETPVGCVKEIGMGRNELNYKRFGSVVEKYSRWVKHLNSSDAPDALEVYRQVLSAQPDKSVVICSVGFLTNMRKLVEADRDLVARKVKLWVAMACKHPRGREYNSSRDWQSSKIALENWPTPIVFSDFDYGANCFAGKALADSAVSGSPVADAFRANTGDFNGPAGRSAWDETAVLAAVRGVDAYFNTERGAFRMVGEKGENEWTPDAATGPHLRLIERLPKDEVGRIIDELMMRKPGVLSAKLFPGFRGVSNPPKSR
jgi:glucose uptake protein